MILIYPYINFFGSKLSTFNLMIGFGILAAMLLFDFLCKRKAVPPSQFDNLALIAGLCLPVVFLSAALFDKAAHYKTFEEFWNHLFQYTGLCFLGGLLGGLAFFILMYRLIFKNFKLFACHVECLVPGIVIAHFFGRLGCFFGGCCFGFPFHWKLGVVFSTGTPAYLRYGSLPLIPTQLIEAFALLIILTLVLSVIKSRHLFWYILFYSFIRFFLEFLRGDDRGTFVSSWLSPSQYVCVLLFVLAIFILLRKKPNATYQNTSQKIGHKFP